MDVAPDDRLRDISSVRVDDDPMSQTSFDKEEVAEPSALTVCRDDALVEKGAEAPKPRLSPVETRITLASGLLHAGLASTTPRTIFPLHSLPRSFCEKTEKRNNNTITRRKNSKQLAPSCHRKVIERKPRQNLVSDPGGCSGLCCIFLRGRRALLRKRICLGCLDGIRGWSVFCRIAG